MQDSASKTFSSNRHLCTRRRLSLSTRDAARFCAAGCARNYLARCVVIHVAIGKLVFPGCGKGWFHPMRNAGRQQVSNRRSCEIARSFFVALILVLSLVLGWQVMRSSDLPRAGLVDDRGVDELMSAIYDGDASRVKLVLSKGVDANSRDYWGCSMLLHAVWQRHTELVQLLIDRGADPNLADFTDSTPLMSATCMGKSDVTTMLLQAGADPNIRNCAGLAPLHFVAVNGDLGIAKMLLAAGASTELRDNAGKTPADLARDEGNPEAFRLLVRPTKPTTLSRDSTLRP